MSMVLWAWCWDQIRSFWFGYNVFVITFWIRMGKLGVWIEIGYACVEESTLSNNKM